MHCTASPFLIKENEPSESHRWMHCTASPFLIKENEADIDDSESVFAAEGTLAHDKGAEALLMGYSAKDIDDPEMAKYVKGYVDFCLNQLQEGDKLWVEKEVPLFFNPEVEKGTTDCAIISIEETEVKKLRINDLKYGMGVSVEAKKNPQLAIYALSVVHKLLADGLVVGGDCFITIAIYQPRVIGERAVRLWALSYDELCEFCKGVSEKAEVINNAKSWDDVEFDPGEKQCRFCEAKPFCSNYAAYLLDEIPEVGEALESTEDNPTITLPNPTKMTDKQISVLVQSKSELVKWLQSLEDFAEKKIKSGQPIPGLKVVQGQLGNRHFADEEKAKKFLSRFIPIKDRITTKLITAPQAEKYVKASTDLSDEKKASFEKNFDKYVTRNQGGLKLVLENDPRPPAVLSLEDEFAFVSEDDQNLLD
jgi:hypothetical protein